MYICMYVCMYERKWTTWCFNSCHVDGFETVYNPKYKGFSVTETKTNIYSICSGSRAILLKQLHHYEPLHKERTFLRCWDYDIWGWVVILTWCVVLITHLVRSILGTCSSQSHPWELIFWFQGRIAESETTWQILDLSKWLTPSDYWRRRWHRRCGGRGGYSRRWPGWRSALLLRLLQLLLLEPIK